MNYKLNKIVTIKSGVFAKGDAVPDVYCIQATDYNAERAWIGNLTPLLSRSQKLEKHILSVGEVLFAAKGKAFFAVVYDGAFQPAVASTTFLVLQVQSKIVIPEYVAWYINHPQTQNLLWSLAKGSGIPSISKTILEQIEIPVPEVSKQVAILELHKLQIKEKLIQQKLVALRQDYINELTYKFIQ
jgi:restriction endonuclease S subunit